MLEQAGWEADSPPRAELPRHTEHTGWSHEQTPTLLQTCRSSLKPPPPTSVLMQLSGPSVCRRVSLYWDHVLSVSQFEQL